MNSKNRILFLCDQNSLNGFGHFSRCLNLARHLKDKKDCAVFFTGNYESFSQDLMRKYEIDYLLIEEKQSNYYNLSLFQKFTHVIVDSYLITQAYITKIVELPWFTVFIDDTCTLEFTNVDLIINFRVGAEKLNYKSKNKALGSHHFIYKPEFKKIREHKKLTKKVQNVLLFLGGIEISSQWYEKILKIIHDVSNIITIDVITNNSSSLSFDNNKIKFHAPTFKIETFYEKADLVVNGGGLTKYESCFNLIPSASFSMTDLQNEDSLLLEKRGLVYNFGSYVNIGKEKNKILLKALINDFETRKKITVECRKYFPINSNENLCDKLNLI